MIFRISDFVTFFFYKSRGQRERVSLALIVRGISLSHKRYVFIPTLIPNSLWLLGSKICHFLSSNGRERSLYNLIPYYLFFSYKVPVLIYFPKAVYFPWVNEKTSLPCSASSFKNHIRKPVKLRILTTELIVFFGCGSII